MNILQILQIVAALGTLITGAVALFWPLKVQGFTGLNANGGRGITEIRTILGALFIALGGAALYFNMPITYQMLGSTYLTMAIVRGISMLIDKSTEASNIISLAAELVFGVILVL